MLLGLTQFAFALPQTFVQEGLVTAANGRPLDGLHRVEVQLHSALQGGNLLSQEAHPAVLFVNGYYAISVGSEQPLPATIFDQPTLYLAFKIDDGEWLEPRTNIQRVPAAFVANSADVATNVTGDITPTTVSINGALVIDANGNIVRRWPLA